MRTSFVPRLGFYPKRRLFPIEERLRSMLTNLFPLYRFIPLFCIVLLAACLPTQAGPAPDFNRPWRYDDLRWLDPADASRPGHDMLAAYTRRLGPELQIRLDMLDLGDPVDYDLYLALDTGPGGATSLPIQATAGLEWDILLVLPANGSIQVLTSGQPANHPVAQREAGIRLLRDSILDNLQISLNAAATGGFPAGFALQIFLTSAGSQAIADSIGPLYSSGQPPAPVEVLYAFWNSLPAYTPAQALRRWDGAHTGPLGGRHGLYNLLRAARNTRTPLVLLDLKNPASLSALDYVGGLEMVQDMAGNGLLILPEMLPIADLPAWSMERAATEGLRITQEFKLPASQFAFAPSTSGSIPAYTPPSSRIVFIPQISETSDPSRTGIYRWRDRLVIPLPGYANSGERSQQAGLDSPSMETRRALIETALSGAQNKRPLLLLGGDLPASTWGNPQIARATFHYLASRPWIRPLGTYDLLAAYPASTPSTPLSATTAAPPDREPLLADLRFSNNTPVDQAAWQAYLSLFAPVYPAAPELTALRRNYQGQVAALLAASRWADCSGGACAAQPAADCSSDFDLDGRAECNLASREFLALLDPDDGSLVYAFARTDTGFHQLIGPSSQFITGLSEASGWDLSRGMSADPDVIPGAFANPNVQFHASPEEDQVVFISPDGNLRKTFRLISHGLEVEVQSGTGDFIQTHIPVALDPWLRFSRNWHERYRSGDTDQGWFGEVWHDPPSRPLRLEIRTSAELTGYNFNDSRHFLGSPEDPNRDYPPGHFLPFPLALVVISASGDLQVQLMVE